MMERRDRSERGRCGESEGWCEMGRRGGGGGGGSD